MNAHKPVLWEADFQVTDLLFDDDYFPQLLNAKPAYL